MLVVKHRRRTLPWQPVMAAASRRQYLARLRHMASPRLGDFRHHRARWRLCERTGKDLMESLSAYLVSLVRFGLVTVL